MPRQFRIVALSIWRGLAPIWSGQEVLGLLLGVFLASAPNLALVARWIWGPHGGSRGIPLVRPFALRPRSMMNPVRGVN
jgi:hypothetical protein